MDSPVGSFTFWSNDAVIGTASTKNGSELVFNPPGQSPCLQFQFKPKPGAGHFGYIQLVPSGLVVFPYGPDPLNPEDGAKLVVRENKNAGALFKFVVDENGMMLILHNSGKSWRSKDGHPNPKGNSQVTINSSHTVSSKFLFRSQSGNYKSPYPKATLSAGWDLLRAFITPIADHTYKQTYRIGRSKSVSKASEHTWEVSGSVAYGWFVAEASYSGALKETSQETWNEEREESYTISVTGNPSVFVWQYVFTVSQYNEEIKFLSSIIGDTSDANEPPLITVLNAKEDAKPTE